MKRGRWNSMKMAVFYNVIRNSVKRKQLPPISGDILAYINYCGSRLITQTTQQGYENRQ
jgi:hypothetical protein